MSLALQTSDYNCLHVVAFEKKIEKSPGVLVMDAAQNCATARERVKEMV